MFLKDTPIQRKLMMVLLLTSGAGLILISTVFFAYEFFTFRQSMKQQISLLGEIIANNSTAALAFDDKDNANEILSALKAEQHIVAACLYDENGNLFSKYPANRNANEFPAKLGTMGYYFEDSYLVGFQNVVQGNKHLGTLFLKSDMEALRERFTLFGFIAGLVLVASFFIAYLLSKKLQQTISKPILALAATSKAISDEQDYSVRATKFGEDELGLLTDSFNHMLNRIQKQNREIRTFNQSLEKKVEERTNELETANRELESFSYSISHDLRAPLRIINGYTDILTTEYDKLLGDEGKRLTKIIMKNAKHMGQLIDDMLDLSRLGRAELNKQPVEMNQLVKSILTEQQTIINNSHTEIKVDNLPTADCDINLIRQVWINLISNAIKYSGKKEKPIVEIGSTTGPNEIIFFVRDNGAGFEMKYASKLFGVFQRLHKQTEFEGTGVGLAIVNRIVTRHKGKVWAEAEADKGATFYFSLPK